MNRLVRGLLHGLASATCVLAFAAQASVASDLEANLSQALRAADKRTPLPDGPLLLYESLVVVRVSTQGGKPLVDTRRLVKFSRRAEVLAVEPHTSSEPRPARYDLFVFGGLVAAGWVEKDSWKIYDFSAVSGQLEPMAVGRSVTVTTTIPGMVADTYTIKVVDRLERVSGFEWLDGELFVLSKTISTKFLETNQVMTRSPQVILYSPVLGAPVYVGTDRPSDPPILKVVGARVEGRHIGLNVTQAAADPSALLTPARWGASMPGAVPRSTLASTPTAGGTSPTANEAAPTPSGLPRSALVLDDATAVCDCSRKLGRCTAGARIREQQVARLSNGLSSLVIVGLAPPPNKCVEVTAYLDERSVIGGRARSTGHPLYRVINGPTDVEWRNVGTPASEVTYSTAPRAAECFVCQPKQTQPPGAEAGKRPMVGPGKGPFFHASIMEAARTGRRDMEGDPIKELPHLAIGLSTISADDARRRACHWPSGAGGVSGQACLDETLTETFGPTRFPEHGGHTQKVLKCDGGGYFAIALSSGPIGVACGAGTRERAEQSAIEACREGWSKRGLPDGGGQPPLNAHYPATCYVAHSALNDGMFAPTGKWTGSRVGGNGLWVNCWGRDRRHFNSSMEANCEGSAKFCLANIGDETCK